MRNAVVCLSFDFDATSLWIARGMTSPTPISRGEFATVGAERLLALLDKHDVRSTWFIPGHTLQTYPALCRRIADAGHEIGNHGWTHLIPASMSREDENAGLARANDAIKSLTGVYPRGYRSPSWDLSENSLELLLQHGFSYDSSMMADDYTPYRVRRGDEFPMHAPAKFGVETSLIEMPISWSLDDYMHFEFVRTSNFVLPGLKSADGVLHNWVEDFLYLKEDLEGDWGCITYTMHPEVIGRGHRLRMLDALICTLKSGGGRFVRMDEAAGEFAGSRPQPQACHDGGHVQTPRGG